VFGGLRPRLRLYPVPRWGLAPRPPPSSAQSDFRHILGPDNSENSNCCVGFIQVKIRSLRVEFSNKLREMTKPSGAEGGKPKKPWRFMENLMFLRDCVVPRGSVSNLPIMSGTSAIDADKTQVSLH